MTTKEKAVKFLSTLIAKLFGAAIIFLVLTCTAAGFLGDASTITAILGGCATASGAFALILIGVTLLI